MVSVIVEDFVYKKKDEDKSYSVLILEADDASICGISLENLTDSEKQQVLDIHKKYCEDMKPFVAKAYRRFLKERIKEKK